MMVCLISPFIEQGLKVLQKRELLYIIGGMTIIEICSIPLRLNWGSSFFGLLYIYILGRSIRLYKIDIDRKRAICVFAVMTLLLLVCLEALNNLPIGKSSLFWFLQFNNPIIILQAIGLFFAFLHLPPSYNKWINSFFAPCLCIYLLTEWSHPYSLVVKQIENNILVGVVWVICVIIGTLFIGHLIFHIADRIVQILFH